MSGKTAALALATIATVYASSAVAQKYPDRAVKIVVPVTAGGQFDIHARLLAERLQKTFGQPFVVENRAGGATMIAAEAVARSAKDGHTLLFAGSNTLSIVPHVYRKVSYKVSDFQPISLLSDLPMALTISQKQIPVKDFKEFVEYVKSKPDQVMYGTSVVGGVQHLVAELVNQRLGLKMTQVSYRGTPEVSVALLGDQVGVTFDAMAAYISNTGPGKPLKVLAVSSEKRIEAAPDIPTFAELGYPELTASTRAGLLAPAGTPGSIIDQLHAALVAANNEPAIRDLIIKGSAIPRTSTPDEFSALIQRDGDKWSEIIGRLNLKLD